MNNQDLEPDLYRILARNLPDMAVFMFDHSLRYLVAEGMALAALGTTPEQLEGKTLYEVAPPETVELIRPRYIAALNGFEDQFNMEFNDRIYHAKAIPIRSNQGDIIAGMCVVRDITEQTKIETNLRQSQKRYQALFEQINDAVFIISLEGRYLEVNHKAAAMLGYEVHELIGMELRQIIDPAEQHQSYSLLEAFKSGQRVPVYERTMVKKDGTKITTEVNITLVHDDKGNLLYIQSVVRDITQRKQAEAALRASEERYRIISELISDFAYSVSFGEDETITYEWMTFGPIVRLTGYTVEELRQKSHLDIYHPEDRAKLIEDRYKLLEGQPVKGEYRVFTKNGEQLWVQVYRRPVWDDRQNQVVRFHAVAQNITERKLAEEALRQSEERFRLVARVTSDALYDLDLTTKTIWRNEGYQKLFGFPYTTTQELDWWTNGIHPDDRVMVLESGYEAIGSSAETWEREYRFRNYEGKYIDILDRRYIVRDSTGAAVRIVGAISDITQRKQAERQALELKLEREKMRLMNEFITAVSHDFRTPLSIINTSVHLLKKSTNPEYQNHQIEKLQQQVIYIEKLVDGILTMSHLDHDIETDSHETDLNELIVYIDTLKHDAYNRKNLSVTLKLDRQLPPVWVNRDWMYRCFLNVAENAILYTPDGGAITIETCRHHDDFVLEITDTGIGINSEDLQYIFDPLYRGEKHRPTGGQGLGLTIAKRVVEKHGGHIEVESQINQGSTFRLCLPLHTQR
jgi:PAS domain S-box-containing protein